MLAAIHDLASIARVLGAMGLPVLRGLWDDAKEAALKDRIAGAVNEAIAAAEGVGPPPDETLISDVFAAPPVQLQEQLTEVMAIGKQGENEGAFPL